MTSRITRSMLLFWLFVLIAASITGGLASVQIAGAVTPFPLEDNAVPSADASEHSDNLFIEQLGLVPTQKEATSAAASDDALAGCKLLSLKADTSDLRRGYEHTYVEVPVLVTLSCDSMDDAYRAANLVEYGIAAVNEPIATSGVTPR